MQLQQQRAELDALGVRVAIVTFENPGVARAYADETAWPWPVLVDDCRELYRAYGMQRGRASRILGPAAWAVYAKLLLRGRRLHRPTGDIYQLGGDVMLDPLGIVRFHHVGRGPADRPAVAAILDVVRHQSGPSSQDASR